ncbi:hypothetical protein BEP19_12715 [Ammoniphilus oxalaticus]|uniref:Uncharacterized protein n=1 Tax=Ammoniphilus oxalaticus TaxID=66863 RepID=A0A419SGZ6_9BACL|nr:hypothetical protein BEP19_12715 [Ammoniphilus oxalaticus]
MNTLFRFHCISCGKEVLTDSVLLKCCDQVMNNVENITVSNQELKDMMNGYQSKLQVNFGRESFY